MLAYINHLDEAGLACVSKKEPSKSVTKPHHDERIRKAQQLAWSNKEEAYDNKKVGEAYLGPLFDPWWGELLCQRSNSVS